MHRLLPWYRGSENTSHRGFMYSRKPDPMTAGSVLGFNSMAGFMAFRNESSSSTGGAETKHPSTLWKAPERSFLFHGEVSFGKPSESLLSIFFHCRTFPFPGHSSAVRPRACPGGNSPLSILTRSSLERGRVWLLPHKCQLYQAPDHCRKTERSTMVRCEIGVTRSRP